ANYNYMIQSEGSTGLDVLYENAILADEQWATFVQSRAETLPSFRSSITLRTPVGFGPGPAILGIKPLAEWRFNTIITWRDGGKFIVNQSADPEDWLYVHRVDRKMVDLYVSKRIAKGANLYINVQNLFDIKYFNGASGYGDSLRYPWTTPSGNDKYGEYERWYVAKRHRDGYLMWNSNKRDVFIGIRYMF
ncbi:TonB-dependent receptor, partial [bacterium]|nr:TonB-dependent receptor [bacterium]